MRTRLIDPENAAADHISERLGGISQRDVVAELSRAGRRPSRGGVRISTAARGREVDAISVKQGSVSTAGRRAALVLVLVKAGVPSDSDYERPPDDGALALDTSANRLYVRSGGAWKYTTLT